MKYVLVNLICFGMLAYTINLSAEPEPEPEPEQEEETYEPDWDKTIRDIERDTEVHNSWDTWGLNN
jgi:hypothetical protein